MRVYVVHGAGKIVRGGDEQCRVEVELELIYFSEQEREAGTSCLFPDPD